MAEPGLCAGPQLHSEVDPWGCHDAVCASYFWGKYFPECKASQIICYCDSQKPPICKALPHFGGKEVPFVCEQVSQRAIFYQAG